MNLKSKLTEENLYLIAGFICVVLIFPLLYYTSPRHGVKVYDCSIAEISPDYPVEVKEGCRKLRADKIK
jgi:hypothetical protein